MPAKRQAARALRLEGIRLGFCGVPTGPPERALMSGGWATGVSRGWIPRRQEPPRVRSVRTLRSAA